ncbi:MAG TPA: hypothetical protein VGM98_01440 [Schlesneria sp.]
MNIVFASHEVCHGLIAKNYGYTLDRVRLDGPADNPGKVERTIPDGKDGNDPEWARKELALFAAGYVGEEIMFGRHEPRHIHGHPDSDYPMMLQCALVCGDNQADCDIVSVYRDPTGEVDFPRHLWRDNVAIDWTPYERLIHTVQEEVRVILKKQERIIHPLAEWLMQRMVVSGDEFTSELERLMSAHMLTAEEQEEAQRRAYAYALERGGGQLPQFDSNAAVGDFWRAAGEVIRLRPET